MTSAEELLERVGVAWHAAFDLAWASWKAGSLGIGAVIVDRDVGIVARGRNRVLEPRVDTALAGTLLAHAEMDAFCNIGLRTAEELQLYTTVQPCLMCTATSIAMRTEIIYYAAPDPVFEGLDEVLASHSYMEDRLPKQEQLGEKHLAALAALLPLANRVWSKPGQPPRKEWLLKHRAIWEAAVELTPVLSALQLDDASLERVLDELAPSLARLS